MLSLAVKFSLYTSYGGVNVIHGALHAIRRRRHRRGRDRAVTCATRYRGRAITRAVNATPNDGACVSFGVPYTTRDRIRATSPAPEAGAPSRGSRRWWNDSMLSRRFLASRPFPSDAQELGLTSVSVIVGLGGPYHARDEWLRLGQYLSNI